MIRAQIRRHGTDLGPGEYLGELEIVNDGTGSATVGHYTFNIYSKAGARIHTGRILGFPRKQQGAFRLLKLALDQTYPSTQPGRRRRRRGTQP